MADNPTQEELKKVTDEVKELREELAKLREEAKEKVAEEEVFEMGFKLNEFMAMSQTKALQWVTNVLAVRFKQRIEKCSSYFRPIMQLGGQSEMDARTCAGYNRGGNCHSKWHVYEKYGQRAYTEVRLHCCTLCKDALGVMCEHRLIDCPWLKKSTWIEICEGQMDDIEEAYNPVAGPSNSAK